MAAQARIVVHNPADYKQRMVLYSNGYIQSIGGAPPVPQEPAPNDTTTLAGSAGSRPAPTWYHVWLLPARALVVTDWITPGGYVLDDYCKVYPFGSAADITGPWPAATHPFPVARDIAVNPAANGQGYILIANGDLIEFGTGTPAISPVLYGDQIAHKLQLEWSTKKYIRMDIYGRLRAAGGASNAIVDGFALDQKLFNSNLARSFKIYDWTLSKGWLLNAYGRIYTIKGAQTVFGNPTRSGDPFAHDLDVLDTGLGATPLRMVTLDARSGANYEFVVSTPPAVTVYDPVDPEISTTRPEVGWIYTDAQGDAQAGAEVAIFTAAQYGIGGFDPATSPATERFTTNDYIVRGYAMQHDIVNATYRAYVRVTDTAGQKSAWAFKQWVQNVTPLTSPTIALAAVTTITGIEDTQITAHVASGSIPTGGVFAVQYHDSDWDGVTWEWVRSGHALVPNGSGDAVVVDPEPRFGVSRTYRALMYVPLPFRASPWSATSSRTASTRVWALTTPVSTAYGGIVSVEPPFEYEEEVPAGVFKALGRQDPIIVSGGKPYLPVLTPSFWALNTTTRQSLEALLRSDLVLLLRSPFGEAWYCKPIESIVWQLLKAAKQAGDVTPTRDSRHIETQLQGTGRPMTGPGDDEPLASLVA